MRCWKPIVNVPAYHLWSVSSLGKSDTTLIMSRHTNPMLSTFFCVPALQPSMISCINICHTERFFYLYLENKQFVKNCWRSWLGDLKSPGHGVWSSPFTFLDLTDIQARDIVKVRRRAWVAICIPFLFPIPQPRPQANWFVMECYFACFFLFSQFVSPPLFGFGCAPVSAACWSVCWWKLVSFRPPD